MLKYISLLLPTLLLAGNLAEFANLSTQNETLKASKNLIDSAKKSKEATFDSYLPTLDIGSNYDIVSKENIMTPKNSSTTYAKASFTIYDGGKREALLREKKSLINVAKYNYQNSENKIVLDTINFYFAKLNSTANIEAKKQEIEQLRAELKRLEKFHMVGSASKDEVEKIKARVALSESDLASLDLSMQEIELNLEWLIGQKMELLKGSTIKEPLKESSKIRADIKAQKASLKAQKEVANREKSGYLPTLKVENSYSFYEYDYSSQPDFDLGLVDEQNKFTVSLNWRAFDFGSSKEAYEAQMLKYRADSENLKASEKRANLEFIYAKKALLIAKTKIKASEARVISADETYEAIKKKFRAGIVNNVTYLDALKEKFEAKAYLEVAKNDYEVKKAEYYYYAGVDIKEYIK